MNLSCQRQTQVAGLPVANMIALVPVLSADKSTIRARQTCFCGEDGAEMIAARRRRSLGDTITQFLCASPSIAHLEIQRNPNSDSFVPVNPLDKTAKSFGIANFKKIYDDPVKANSAKPARTRTR
jgi:hypothetical protein